MELVKPILTGERRWAVPKLTSLEDIDPPANSEHRIGMTKWVMRERPAANRDPRGGCETGWIDASGSRARRIRVAIAHPGARCCPLMCGRGLPWSVRF